MNFVAEEVVVVLVVFAIVNLGIVDDGVYDVFWEYFAVVSAISVVVIEFVAVVVLIVVHLILLIVQIVLFVEMEVLMLSVAHSW